MTVVGIDLGTTNSLVAYWSEEGPKIIQNVFGDKLTPSVVSIDENDEILIGKVAKERLISHPNLTISAFKRYMGTDKKIQLGRHSFSPEELSSFILKSLKEDAEAFLGEEVTEAVISVPAYFNDLQRKATKKAAEIAGLKVERLISEPTAAAITYGLHQEESETKFVVFDLGGGTFDVSILEMFEGVMEVKAIAGNNFLGGEDFTNLLVNYFLDKEKIDLETLSFKDRALLYKQGEMCKRSLGENGSGTMTFTLEESNYEVSINKLQFEKLADKLLLKLSHPVERALMDAEISPREVDAVILIGGATRMPIIKNIVGKMFGKLPYSNINPDEAVALGAAIQVALKERNEALSEVILTDVCPYTLGIEIAKQKNKNAFEAGYFSPIIERNTPIPVSRVESFVTVRDKQDKISVKIYQGESRRVEENIKLGELEVKVPKDKRGNQGIDVRFTYDINGILEVEVLVLSTGVKNRIVVNKNQEGMSEREIEKRLDELKKIKIHPRDKMENKLLIAKAERMYEETLGEKRQYVGNLIEIFEQALYTQEERKVAKAAKEFRERLEQLEGWVDY
ncbi:molecular chaperone HscC [Candidatus Clostridium radicumherbarum]|uniref:Chaperone protein DnaK n=1 Tax=Candidatus Clostridium radicumherbarum TaxID=3381662 RepID=A0ABW8TRQ8_9CLOT